MIKRARQHIVKRYLIGLGFLLLFFTPEPAHPHATANPHPASTSFLSRAVTWMRTLTWRIGPPSLEFEIHGASLQLSEVIAHLGASLPPAVRDLNPSGEMIFDLKVAPARSPAPEGTVLNLDLEAGNVAFSSSNSLRTHKPINVRIRLELSIPRDPDQPLMIRGDMSVEAGELVVSRFRINFAEEPLRLHLSGLYDPKKDRLAPLSVQFEMPSLGRGTISATLERLNDPTGEVRVALGPIRNRRAFELFVREPFGHVSPSLKELSIAGTTFLTLSIRGSRHRSSIRGLLEMSNVELAIPAHEIAAKGLDVQFPFQMEFPESEGTIPRADVSVMINGLVRAEAIHWKSLDWQNIAVPVAFARNMLLLGKTELPMLGGTLILNGASIEDPFGKAMKIELGLGADRIDLAELTNAVLPSLVPFVPPGHLEGKFSEITFSADRFAARGSLTVHALGGQIQVSNIEGVSPLSGLPKVSMDMFLEDIRLEEKSLGAMVPAAITDWKLSGSMALDLARESRKGPDSSVRAVRIGLQLRDGAFSSPEERFLGDGLQGDIHFDVGIPTREEQPLTFQADLHFEAGEALLGSLYLNLQEDPIRLQWHAVYERRDRRIPSLTFGFDAPTIGKGTIQAALESLDGPVGEANISLGPIVNERAFELFVKGPFGYVSPVLKAMSINGETHLTALIRGSPERYSIQGLVETTVQDLDIPSNNVGVKGLRIQLPLFLGSQGAHQGASATGPSQALRGFIRAESIQWKSQAWEALDLPLTLKDNILFLPPRVELPLWGGTMTLRGSTIVDPFRKTREIRLGLGLEGLDLSRVTGSLTSLALPGWLESDFSEILLSREHLDTRGHVTIHALGGQIRATDIQGTNPFSRLREISMDVTLSDLNLEEISQFFSFGQMGGVVVGQVKGLRFSFGQPEAFEFEIQSVNKKGVRQYVNAEAVDDLSTLSSGSPSPGGVVLRFFKYFPYSKLGIYCTLENDVFTLRGTIHERGVEYLIRRQGLRGIDVINRNPENRIRWKQMLRRLKAVSHGMAAARNSNQN